MEAGRLEMWISCIKDQVEVRIMELDELPGLAAEAAREAILADARVRAARGAARLTEAGHCAECAPFEGDDGWRDMIDPDRLDLDCVINCVLGQLYGSYSYGVSALYVGPDDGNRSDWARKHGFSGASYAEDEALRVAWLEIIGAS